LVNPELIKYILENILRKYSGNNNPEVIFKRDKIVFFENDRCRKKFIKVQKEKNLKLVAH